MVILISFGVLYYMLIPLLCTVSKPLRPSIAGQLASMSTGAPVYANIDAENYVNY
jgi:hypothetical protein